MKKVLSVFLAMLMLLSAFSVVSFAEEKYPAPAEPANLALTAEGIATWDAVDVPAYVETDGYETACAIEYRVKLLVWDYDDKDNTWGYVQVGDEIVAPDATADLSAGMKSGKYGFSVTAVANYSRTMLSNGKVANFKRVSEEVVLDKANAVSVTYDLYAEPIDDSIPFESLVPEDQEQANLVLKFLKKFKEVVIIILRFLGYAGDVSGISDEIANKKNR